MLQGDAKKWQKWSFWGHFFGLKKHSFFAILGVKKFFRRRIRVFQLFLPLEMMFLEKNFFEKMALKNFKIAVFLALGRLPTENCQRKRRKLPTTIKRNKSCLNFTKISILKRFE